MFCVKICGIRTHVLGSCSTMIHIDYFDATLKSGVVSRTLYIDIRLNFDLVQKRHKNKEEKKKHFPLEGPARPGRGSLCLPPVLGKAYGLLPVLRTFNDGAPLPRHCPRHCFRTSPLHCTLLLFVLLPCPPCPIQRLRLHDLQRLPRFPDKLCKRGFPASTTFYSSRLTKVHANSNFLLTTCWNKKLGNCRLLLGIICLASSNRATPESAFHKNHRTLHSNLHSSLLSK